MTLDVRQLKGRAVLAPLAGVADSSFRLICREMGAAMVFTEMISADGLVQQSEKTYSYLFFRKKERPIGFQLFGSNPDIFARAMEIVLPYEPDFIDINFGCPVKKVVKRGAGAALLKNLPLLEQIARAVVRHSTVPVFAKIRKGWDSPNINAVEVAKILEQSGVQTVTIHPRTQTEQFRGHSDWEMIARVKAAVSIPVIGNGDIRIAADAQRMIDETGCDLVMIGRGSLGNPWLFRQVNDLLNSGVHIPPPDLTERLDVMLRHFDDKISLSGTRQAILEMRKHFSWYIKGLPGSSRVRAELFLLKDVESIKNKLREFFSKMGEL